MNEFEIGVRSLILHNRKALLMKRSNKSGKRNGIWEFPGGVVEFGEDLHTALRREIKEEAGLEDIHIEKLLYAVTFLLSPSKQTIGLMYLCHTGNDAVHISEEHVEFIWADRKQVISLLHKGMLNELEEHAVLDLLEID